MLYCAQYGFGCIDMLSTLVQLATLKQRLVNLPLNIVPREVDFVGGLAHSGPQLMVVVGRAITIKVNKKTDHLRLEAMSVTFVMSLGASLIMFSLWLSCVPCVLRSPVLFSLCRLIGGRHDRGLGCLRQGIVEEDRLDQRPVRHDAFVDEVDGQPASQSILSTSAAVRDVNVAPAVCTVTKDSALIRC